jgi:nickel-type superoxide dismutase maturation protease
MEPALRPGDWLLVRRTRRIRPGQIVLARHPARPGMLVVKRAARLVDDGWWLTSDNPQAGAVDSGRFGAVPPALIVGRVLARYWRKTPLCRTCRGASRRSGFPARKPKWPRRQTGPLRLGRALAQCRILGSGVSPACRLTSSSISSRGSFTAIAQ